MFGFNKKNTYFIFNDEIIEVIKGELGGNIRYVILKDITYLVLYKTLEIKGKNENYFIYLTNIE